MAGTPSTLTSFSISTHWKMSLSSPAMGSSRDSGTARRASLAMRRTVSLSTDMKIPALEGWFLLATGGSGGKQKGQKGRDPVAVVTLEELKLAPGLRLLGLDLGEKTIGLALSDTGLSIATPMQTLKRGKFAADATRLDIIISEQGVGGL